MATKKINYKDKAPLQTKPEIPEENKVNAEDLNQIKEVVNNNADEIELRQLKEEGKGLSKNDFTDELKAKLESLNNYNDTEIKKEISEINKKVTENTQNDIKQDNEILELKTNYANLQEQNTKLESQIKKDRENMINLEVEGQSIHIEDSSDLEGQLEVSGNVEQDVREGYNLFNNIATNGEYNGVTRIVNKDKSITFNGNSSNNWANYKIGEFKGENKKYYLSGSPKTENFNKIFLTVHNPTGADIAQSKNGSIVEFTPETGITYEVICAIAPNTNLSNINFKPMITTESNKEKPYEPYGASPSPEYPSTVRAVGDKGSVGIKKTTANYYNVKSYAGSQPPPVDENDWITITGNNTGTSPKYLNYFTRNLDVIVGEKYWIVAEVKNVLGKGTFNITSQNNNQGQFKGYVKQIQDIKAGDVFIYQSTAVKTKGDEQGLRTFIELRPDESANITFRLSVLEENPNNTNWKYVPYKKETKILPIQKPMLEGDYFIKEADGWKEVHNWENKVINGTETMVDGNSPVADNTLVVSISRKDSGLTSDKINIISEQFKGNTTANLWVTDKEGISLSAGYISVRINRKRANTLEEVKEYLKQNNIKCFLKKSTENKLLCTPEQTKVLEELDNFQTYKPVTNITTDSIAKLKLKYIADTKTYIDNKTSNLEQQVNTINQLLSTTRTSAKLLDNLQSDIESEVL